MTTITKPIIIVGTGRCGSTMLHRLLAQHEDVGTTSTFNEAFPTQPWLSVFSPLYCAPWISRGVKHWPCFPKPFEAYRFWERYLPGFSRRDKPLTPEDCPSEGIEPVRKNVARLLAYQKKNRFLAKVTGWSRIAYFDRIFPDARFVFLNREPRAVISSWIQAGWLDVTSEVDSSTWQWGPVPDLYRQLWDELGRGPVLSAAVKVQLDLDDVRRNMELFPEQSYELDYDDLIASPIEELQALIQFCQLPWTVAFERKMRLVEFRDTRNKWKQYLSEADGERIQEFFLRARESANTQLAVS
jgi:omega-hydroxy-beta-dihydromenaquinone-9 sulfotransferase